MNITFANTKEIIERYSFFWYGIGLAVVAIIQLVIFARCSESILVNRYTLGCLALAEISPILLVLFVVPRRWRWVALVLPGLILLTQLINSLYYPNIRDVFPLSDVRRLNDLDSDILGFATDYIAWWQGALMLPYIMLVGFYFCFRSSIEKTSVPLKNRLIGIGLSLLCLFSGFWKIVYYVMTDDEIKENQWLLSWDIYTADEASGRNYAMKRGYFPYYLIQLSPFFHRNELTQEDCREITEWIHRDKGTLDEYTAQVFEANKTKRLIFIIVECWSSSTFFKEIEGIQVTPYLDSLAHAKGTIFFPNMLTQVKGGTSSDAHLMYNTGLYPLRIGCTASDSRLPYLPTLARQIAPKGHSMEIFGEPADHYSHGKTSRAYGYGNMSCDLTYEDDHMMRCDKVDPILFNEAERYLSEHPEVELLTVCTLGMHGDAQPYELNKFTTPPILNAL